MSAVIVPYVNPDLDGVACSLALESMRSSPAWQARMLGKPDTETIFVVNELGLALPPPLTSWNGIDAIWLVDTHHPRQLPDDLPAQFVLRITDHHPGGSPSSYPNAKLQNELVGAAATLIAEQLEQQNTEIPSKIAVLLQCAIISNTLEFRARATTERDRSTYGRLAKIEPVQTRMIEGMRRTRGETLELDTVDLLTRDMKSFETRYGLIIIAQVEAPDALKILSRPDFFRCLEQVCATKHAACALVNLVDIESGRSAILGTDQQIMEVVSRGLKHPIGADGAIRIGRLLQRKTDIVPYITG